jgi:hypothetical protein
MKGNLEEGTEVCPGVHDGRCKNRDPRHGSFNSLVRSVVKGLRRKGVKAGAIKLRVFRPFPMEELQDMAGHLEPSASSIGTSHSVQGIVHSEVAAAIHLKQRSPAHQFCSRIRWQRSEGGGAVRPGPGGMGEKEKRF